VKWYVAPTTGVKLSLWKRGEEGMRKVREKAKRGEL
jgi:hypothetical protein